MRRLLAYVRGMPIQDTISPELIRDAREAAGLTQDAAAAATGLTRATIQNAETGRRRPAGYVLAAMARAYGVPMDAFVGTPSSEVAS